jgi:hypothetical protein
MGENSRPMWTSARHKDFPTLLPEAGRTILWYSLAEKEMGGGKNRQNAPSAAKFFVVSRFCGRYIGGKMYGPRRFTRRYFGVF